MRSIDLSKYPKYTPDFPFENPERGSREFFLSKIHEGLRLALADFVGKKAEIAANADLSPQGVAKQLASAGSEILSRIARIADKDITRAKDEIRVIQGGLESSGGDPVQQATAQSRHREIRAYLLTLDKEERAAAIREAVDVGDIEALEAVAGAPGMLRQQLTLPQIAELIEKEVLRQRDPGQYDDLQRRRQAVDAVCETRQIVEDYLKAEGKVEETKAERFKATA